MTMAATKSDLPGRLTFYFARNGYLRGQSNDRLDEGHEAYKKGWEVRLVLHSSSEVDEVRRLIERAGMRPGKVFQKHQCWIQPIYGRDAVMRFKSVPRAPHQKRVKVGAQQRLTSLKTPLKKR
jgi:hypothetical protein